MVKKVPVKASPKIVEAPAITAPEAPKTLEIPKSELKKWLDEAPEAKGDLTQQWYGEEFQPTYKAWLQKGKELVK